MGTMGGHAVFCQVCGDDLGERTGARLGGNSRLGHCRWPNCKQVSEHASHGVCTWCIQHGDQDTLGRLQSRAALSALRYVYSS